MSAFDFAVVAVFGFLVALRALVVLVLGTAIIRPVRQCPACFSPTVAVAVKWLARLSSRYEWRWCPDCRWEGLARRASGKPSPSGAGRAPGIPGRLG